MSQNNPKKPVADIKVFSPDGRMEMQTYPNARDLVAHNGWSYQSPEAKRMEAENQIAAIDAAEDVREKDAISGRQIAAAESKRLEGERAEREAKAASIIADQENVLNKAELVEAKRVEAATSNHGVDKKNK